jgi:hypothetical protein
MTEDFLHINAEMPAAGGGLAANPIHGFAH